MNYFITAVIVAGGLIAVAFPLLRRNTHDDQVVRDDAALEQRISEYRAALTAHTVCSRCLRANPPDARFCADCGQQLAAFEEMQGTT